MVFKSQAGKIICVFLVLWIVLAGGFLVGQSRPQSDREQLENAKRWGFNENTIWELALYEGLMRIHQGQYKETYEYLSQMVQKQKPGAEVHRCIALLRLAFAKMHGVKETAGEWGKSAQQQIGLLESKENKSDGDYVLLAALKYVDERQGGALAISKPYLDYLLLPTTKSLWADWAYWEKTRLTSRTIWAIGDELGIVTCEVGKNKQLGCLVVSDCDGEPERTIRARGASVFLNKHPHSYMARQMRIEILDDRKQSLSRALEVLSRGDWYLDGQTDGLLALTTEQFRELRKKTYSDLKALDAKIPACVTSLFRAEYQLDDFLYSGKNAPGEDSIINYFQGVNESRGRKSIPESILKWLDSMPAIKKPEIHRAKEVAE